MMSLKCLDMISNLTVEVLTSIQSKTILQGAETILCQRECF
jgi:hypothetical protein